MNNPTTGVIECVFNLVVDYTQCPEERIKTGGCDEVYNSALFCDAIRTYPPDEKNQIRRKRSFAVFHFKRKIRSDEAIKRMEKRGYRPATLLELLAASKTKRNLHQKLSMIALIALTPFFGHDALGDCVPVIVKHSRGRESDNCFSVNNKKKNKRELSYRGLKPGWSKNARFLAVKE